ncbi:hypothetical protein H0H92_002100 [Tricholoma furcatifolium]|nr:hypothetical protein H0H92_002100 [Tricholoma furcatifolium]
MGEERLHVSDPKAVQYIYQTSGYNFPKQLERRESSRLITGKGILWADGTAHKRQRKVMLPGFSGPEAKGYLPVFSSYAAKMASKWQEIVDSSADRMASVDIPSWASRCALDAIGEVAFDYPFGTLDNVNNALGKAYTNLLLDTFGSLTNREIFFANIMVLLPAFIREYVGDNIPSAKLIHARNATKLSKEVSTELIRQKEEAILQGTGKNDVMSLFVKANASEKENARLTAEEMLGAMRVIILAGHETTANTLSWALLELSRRPDIQTKLRNEIKAVEKAFLARGDDHYTSTDLDSMAYLNAVLKETLRYHPVVISLIREAARDDVIPLSTPIRTVSGELITEIPVSKGQKVSTSIGCYNRQVMVFGDDADVFDPERWLDSRVKKQSTVGVIGNLMSFGSGIRVCIGWKFAVVELQAFLFELLGKFEFLPDTDPHTIRREAALVMVPTIEGEVEKGAQLSLRIRPMSKDSEEV